MCSWSSGTNCTTQKIEKHRRAFDWIQDRVRQKQIKVEWIAGGKNLGDFFTKSLPVHVHQELAPCHASPPSTVPTASSTVPLQARVTSDTGATHLLLRHSSLPLLRHLFQPKLLPSLDFSLPDGGVLPVNGANAGVLTFKNKSETVACYVVPDSLLAHNLFGTSPLIRPNGRALYDPTSVQFFDSPVSAVPFLSGSKSPDADLWHLQVPL